MRLNKAEASGLHKAKQAMPHLLLSSRHCRMGCKKRCQAPNPCNCNAVKAHDAASDRRAVLLTTHQWLVVWLASPRA